MNINFSDGINDGKFFSIYSGKYDEFGEEDIDISTEIEEDEEDDTDTCLNRFAALEKDASKIHMDLNNLRNEYNGIFHNQEMLNDKVYTLNNKIENLTSEFRGSCKDWNDLSETVDHMLNSIAELRTVMNKADDRLNKRFNVISEANVVLTDKFNLVEKKLEVFKCIDILDRVSKLERRCDTDDKLIGDLGRHIDSADNLTIRLGRFSERIDKLQKSVDYCLDWINRNGENTSNDISSMDKNDPVNHPKHYTDGKYECIDFIHQYGLGFDLGNAVKYITRAGIKSKDTYIQDLEKALWYLEHHIKDPINPVVFSKPNMIPVDDYCHDKMLTDELTRVIEDIVNDDIGTAAWILTKYIQGLKNEQSK